MPSEQQRPGAPGPNEGALGQGALRGVRETAHAEAPAGVNAGAHAGVNAEPEILPATRASDADRTAVTGHLQEAFADGRLDEEEFDVRMQRALSAKTRQELSRLVEDLGLDRAAAGMPIPTAPGVSPGLHAAAEEYRVNTAVLSSVSRKGRWVVPSELNAIAIMGEIKLDLRAATLTSPVTTIRVRAILGEVRILVPPGVRLELHGTPILAELTDRVDDHGLPPGAPVVRVDAVAVLGEVSARTRTPGETFKQRWRRMIGGSDV